MTRILVEIMTPHRKHADEIVTRLSNVLVPLTVQVPETWLNIHVCPEEEMEKEGGE